MPVRPRIVFDTNALISAAILPKSVSRKAFLLGVARYELIVSQATWMEFVEKIDKPSLAPYFSPLELRLEFVLFVNRVVKHVVATSIVTDCTDPDDNRFLELALDGKAGIIVTGDNKLLELDGWRGIRILKPGAFVRDFA
jgi:uncharacterized protein